MIGEICKVTVLVGSYCSATWATCTVLVQTQARQGTHDRPGKDRAGVDRGHNVMMASPADTVTSAVATPTFVGCCGRTPWINWYPSVRQNNIPYWYSIYGRIIFRTGTSIHFDCHDYCGSHVEANPGLVAPCPGGAVCARSVGTIDGRPQPVR